MPNHFGISELLTFFIIFASLVGNSAASFTSWLARSLAFSTSTIFCAFTQVTSIYCINMFHDYIPPYKFPFILTRQTNNIKLKRHSEEYLYKLFRTFFLSTEYVTTRYCSTFWSTRVRSIFFVHSFDFIHYAL